MKTLLKHKAPAGTQAILRAIRLLKSFTPERPELSLAQLHVATGLKKPTAHRLLLALQSEGFVERGVQAGSFHLGPALIALGSQAMATNDLRASARPVLEQRARESGETTTLEVLVDDSMLIIDAVAGSHLVTGSLGIGTRWPLHATSTGKSLLAAMPEEQIAPLMATSFESFTDRTLTDAKLLQRELETIREQGYSSAIEELETGFIAVGAAFKDPFGAVEGAISISGPASRFAPEKVRELGAALRAAAARLSTRHQGRPAR